MGVRAPAKINLALAVVGRRPDGYHELRSVFLRLDLADTLTLSELPGAPVTPDELVIEGDPDCPVDGNLVLRAIFGFRGACAATRVPPTRAVLAKRIPMAAGLAGGSSDAATTLRLLSARHPGLLTSSQLGALAARIGADVPFFLDGAGAALVAAWATRWIRCHRPSNRSGCSSIRPPFGSSTPLVFGAWDALAEQAAAAPGVTIDAGSERAVDDLAQVLRAGATPGDLVELTAVLRAANDLWPPAVRLTPRLARPSVARGAARQAGPDDRFGFHTVRPLS